MTRERGTNKGEIYKGPTTGNGVNNNKNELNLGDSNWKFFEVGYPVDIHTHTKIFYVFGSCFRKLAVILV